MKLLLVGLSDADRLASELTPMGIRASVTARGERPCDPASFDAVVLDSHGPLHGRTAEVRSLRGGGFAGAILVVCAAPGEAPALLEAGADDFVVAPAQASELAARIQVTSRRGTSQGWLRWGGMALDRVSRMLRVEDLSVALTERESALLTALILAGGEVVSRATLRERLWKRTEKHATNVVEVNMSRLREKLGEHADVIETVRRIGYRLRR